MEGLLAHRHNKPGIKTGRGTPCCTPLSVWRWGGTNNPNINSEQMSSTAQCKCNEFLCMASFHQRWYICHKHNKYLQNKQNNQMSFGNSDSTSDTRTRTWPNSATGTHTEIQQTSHTKHGGTLAARSICAAPSRVEIVDVLAPQHIVREHILSCCTRCTRGAGVPI